jgi:DNA polymerase (family 10)
MDDDRKINVRTPVALRSHKRRGADWSRVFAVAAELDKAVEVDSYPDRQDMSLDLIKLARKAGCRISLGTDSRGTSQLEFIEFGRL